jgi:hypothetical protein
MKGRRTRSHRPNLSSQGRKPLVASVTSPIVTTSKAPLAAVAPASYNTAQGDSTHDVSHLDD